MDKKEFDHDSVKNSVDDKLADATNEEFTYGASNYFTGLLFFVVIIFVLVSAFIFRKNIFEAGCYFDLAAACVISADFYTDNDEKKLEKYIHACNGEWVWKVKGCYKAGQIYEGKYNNMSGEGKDDLLVRTLFYYKQGCPSDFREEENDQGACNKIAEFEVLTKLAKKEKEKKDKDKKDLYESAMGKFNQKNFKGAIEDISEFIRIVPNDPSAYNLRGITKSELGEYEGAVQDYKKVIELIPNEYIGYYNQALVFIFLGRKEDAQKNYEIIKNLKQDDFAKNNFPIMSLILEEKYDEANDKVRQLKEASVKVDTDFEKFLRSKI